MSILNSLLPLYQKDSITHFDITVKNGVNYDFCFVIDKELTDSPPARRKLYGHLSLLNSDFFQTLFDTKLDKDKCNGIIEINISDDKLGLGG